MKIQKQLILLSFLYCICIATVQNFRFTRSLQCIDKKLSQNSCHDWNQTTILYRYSDYYYYCFPGQTFVLTSQGPKQMKQLKLTDQLFGFDIESQKNGFFQIKAWLHYDANSLFRYNQITIQNSDQQFYISGYHNVGYIQGQTYKFKFAKNLQNGDELISFANTQKQIIVKNNTLSEEKLGLYSPMTEKGTFYIYSNNNVNILNLNQIQKRDMILVHSLSQINSPVQNFNKAINFLSVYSLFANSYQPSQEDQYVNPLISQFSFLFSNDWQKVESTKVLHRYSSYSNNNQQRQREQRKRKTMAVLALNSILKDTMI